MTHLIPLILAKQVLWCQEIGKPNQLIGRVEPTESLVGTPLALPALDLPLTGRGW